MEAVKEGGREVWRKEEGQRVRKKGGGSHLSPAFTFRFMSRRKELWRGGVHEGEEATDSRSRALILNRELETGGASQSYNQHLREAVLVSRHNNNPAERVEFVHKPTPAEIGQRFFERPPPLSSKLTAEWASALACHVTTHHTLGGDERGQGASP